MPKTSVFVKFTAHPGQRDDLLAALEKALPSVQDEPGTERYLFCFDMANPDVLWGYEQYADDDAFSDHASGPAVAALFRDLGPLLAAPPELTVTKLVGGKGADS